MLATALGLEFDPNIAWKEREQVFKMAGKIVKTMNITQSAIGKSGKWTTVVACGLHPIGNLRSTCEERLIRAVHPFFRPSADTAIGL